MSNNNEHSPSVKDVVRDIVAVLILLIGGFFVEKAKIYFFDEHVPFIISVIICIIEITLALGFFSAFIYMCKNVVIASKELGSALPSTLINVALGNLEEVIEKGIANGMRFALAIGALVIVAICMLGMFLIGIVAKQFIGGTHFPLWIYFIISITTILPPTALLYFIHTPETKKREPHISTWLYAILVLYIVIITMPSLLFITISLI